MSDVLLLNIDYTPLGVLNWRTAMEKIVSGKVELVQAYVDRVIRSPNREFPFPAVVRLVTRYAKQKVRLNRRNIFARDAYTCQYCQVQPRRSSGRPDLEQLSIDHVVPRAQGREGKVLLPWSRERVPVTSWKNVLTACRPCNFRKADRTPGEAGLTMHKRPRAPNTLEIAWMRLLDETEFPDEWKQWLPVNSPWRDYWEVELE